MKSKILMSLLALSFAGFTTAASAVTINFDNTECPTCVNGSNVGGNEWSSFGISVSNAYWYTDSRDTFDNMGLAVSPTPGIITLSSVSNGATIDYVVISGRSIYEAFDSAHVSLGSLAVDASSGDVLGTHSFLGAVASIEWTGDTGTAGISTLTISAVPEPETYAMLLAGLGLLGFAARRRQQNV